MAERALNLILEDINDAIKLVSFGAKITTWGLAYLQTKDDKTFPLINSNSKNATKISWDDKYPLQTYHRILSSEKEIDPSQGFGNKAHRRRVYEMRLVGIGSKGRLSAAAFEDNQEFAHAIGDVMPSFINPTEYLEVSDLEVIKRNVYNEEFAGVENQHPLSLEGIAFWINYKLSIRIC